MEETIVVGMADYKLACGTQKLMTRDLGSCVAVAIRDPEKKIGGLLHIMLPVCMKSEKQKEEEYPKYADTGIDLLIKELLAQGVSKRRLTAKLAGAAHMVKTQTVPESQDLSSQNLEAVKQRLAYHQIPIIAMEVGDAYPRTVIFEPESGILQIKTMRKKDRFI